MQIATRSGNAGAGRRLMSAIELVAGSVEDVRGSLDAWSGGAKQ